LFVVGVQQQQNSVRKNKLDSEKWRQSRTFHVTLFISVVPTEPTATVFNGTDLAQASLTINDEAVCIIALSRSFEDRS
jgi:hypothetical protein